MGVKQLQMVVTDLDGTLFNPQRQISEQDYQTLVMLGAWDVCRVIATGRSLYSADRVLAPDLPIDYLIFSSGAGIVDWRSKDLLYRQSLNAIDVAAIAHQLIIWHIDFMILHAIPESHKFVYHKTNHENPDFIRRIEIYQQFAEPLRFDPNKCNDACEILVIIPDNVSIYDHLRRSLSDFKVIRATSPLDGKSIWIEIFPSHVSKASAAAWICQKQGCEPGAVLGIGNDYNDLDLLNWTEYSFVMANAPEDLKQKFEITESNSNHGFTKAVMSKVQKL